MDKTVNVVYPEERESRVSQVHPVAQEAKESQDPEEDQESRDTPVPKGLKVNVESQVWMD